MPRRSRRAQPLAREDRRVAVIDATIPLLVAHGREVTSRQIADAAGIAEGTIYSVFTDKEELLAACVQRHFSAETALEAVASIGDPASLESLVDRVVELTQRRAKETFALLAILSSQPATEGQGERPALPHGSAMIEAIAGLFTPYEDRLRVSARRAAHVIRVAAFAMTNPYLTNGQPLEATDIRDILMHGIVSPQPANGLDANGYVP